jgi:hypothetical protein
MRIVRAEIETATKSMLFCGDGGEGTEIARPCPPPTERAAPFDFSRPGFELTINPNGKWEGGTWSVLTNGKFRERLRDNRQHDK